MKDNLAIFEDYNIRCVYDEKAECWFFSVIDIIRALIQQPDYQAARNYWNDAKGERLSWFLLNVAIFNEIGSCYA